MIIVNGKQQNQIDVKDRGLCYGDGLFETIKVQDGVPKLWGMHLDRLITGCSRLRIPVPDSEGLRSDVDKVIHASGPNLVLKLIVTRGVSQRGYAYSGEEKPTVIVMSAPEYQINANDYLTGITAIICTTRLSHNVHLAGIKHLNRLEQVLARAEWHDPFIREGIMLDVSDCVIEGTMSNIFIEKDGVFYTPQLSRAGVCGVMRRKVIETLRAEQRLVCVKDMALTELLNADSVAICNALLGVMPVSRIDNTVFEIGPALNDLVAKKLQNADA
ncbi:aminodeoxychorismate lyase [Alkalimonas amylolytica]|uniref:Aminodeoxychorismate lyase n=1 Tax=Alkalimonas amylolytica TaxID=152573 RepID=A0A1H4AWU3_ALKAM|nr:aminodeoxychorismate lyase [Alkalimonas amylolytica]SEA40316.1 4-amino-4-deoxychorismate lyase [Alkalimonas amylolytica]